MIIPLSWNGIVHFNIHVMNLNNFTIKAQETIAKAQQIAFNNGNPNIETEHLLKSLLDDADSPVTYLLKKNNVNVSFIENKIDESLAKLPKVQGAEPAQSISRDMNNVILRAGALLKTFSDEFVSVEHLLLAIMHRIDVMQLSNFLISAFAII